MLLDFSLAHVQVIRKNGVRSPDRLRLGVKRRRFWGGGVLSGPRRSHSSLVLNPVPCFSTSSPFLQSNEPDLPRWERWQKSPHRQHLLQESRRKPDLLRRDDLKDAFFLSCRRDHFELGKRKGKGRTLVPVGRADAPLIAAKAALFNDLVTAIDYCPLLSIREIFGCRFCLAISAVLLSCLVVCSFGV